MVLILEDHILVKKDDKIVVPSCFLETDNTGLF